jgi:preprotein translocase subunit SecA
VQGEPSFAIVDEVDSILIDEARTPLIISGAAEDSSELYKRINKHPVPQLQRQDPITNEEGKPEGPGDFSVDEKARQVELSEEGHEKVEELRRIGKACSRRARASTTPSTSCLMHHVHAALRAHACSSANVEYIVQDGQIVIVDEFTGRTMPGRRWSEGLHQAVEAKEGWRSRGEPDPGLDHLPELLPPLRQARRHDRHRGYRGLRVPADLRSRGVVIPTNKPMVREDLGDLVYLTREEKFDAIVEDVRTASSAASRCWWAPRPSRPPS